MPRSWVVSSLHDFWPKFCTHFSSLMLHAMPISSSLTWLS
jgi:hypothetical protein